MILFQLRCDQDHHFEGWFKSNDAYDAQVQAGHLSCPFCGSAKVSKAIMAPRLNKATGDALDVQDMARTMRRVLGEVRKQVQTHCDYVGDKFSEEARKIHYGETEARPIYGEASAEDAKALIDEGVDFQAIPWIADEQ